jgi:hypothetical protein
VLHVPSAGNLPDIAGYAECLEVPQLFFPRYFIFTVQILQLLRSHSVEDNIEILHEMHFSVPRYVLLICPTTGFISRAAVLGVISTPVG